MFARVCGGLGIGRRDRRERDSAGVLDDGKHELCDEWPTTRACPAVRLDLRHAGAARPTITDVGVGVDRADRTREPPGSDRGGSRSHDGPVVADGCSVVALLELNGRYVTNKALQLLVAWPACHATVDVSTIRDRREVRRVRHGASRHSSTLWSHISRQSFFTDRGAATVVAMTRRMCS